MPAKIAFRATVDGGVFSGHEHGVERPVECALPSM